MDTAPLAGGEPEPGTLRVAQHFAVADGEIIRIRQIHDTATLRSAGFAN